MLPSSELHEEFIETVDVWQLRQLRWPILRFLAPRFLEERELDRYMRGLLASGRWTCVRVSPQAPAASVRPHIFEVYGR